jgi:hypothetical protein
MANYQNLMANSKKNTNTKKKQKLIKKTQMQPRFSRPLYVPLVAEFCCGTCEFIFKFHGLGSWVEKNHPEACPILEERRRTKSEEIIRAGPAISGVIGK